MHTHTVTRILAQRRPPKFSAGIRAGSAGTPTTSTAATLVAALSTPEKRYASTPKLLQDKESELTDLSPDARAALAAMPEGQLADLLTELRSPLAPLDAAAAELDSNDPKQVAAAALRRSRGLDRGRPATKEQAAEALRGFSG